MKLRVQKNNLSLLKQDSFISLSLGIMVVYFSLMMVLPNYRLVYLTTIHAGAFLPKLQFLLVLLVGSILSHSLLELLVYGTTSLLVGLNGSLAIVSLRRMPQSTHLVFGGESLIGLAAAGCSSCGTSLLSAFAASLGIGLLPFQLLLIQAGVIIILLFSFVRTLQHTNYCKVNVRSKNR